MPINLTPHTCLAGVKRSDETLLLPSNYITRREKRITSILVCPFQYLASNNAQLPRTIQLLLKRPLETVQRSSGCLH